METTKDSIITIDAAGQSLGRVASRAAFLLRGKNSPAFAPNQLARVKVKVTNAAAIRITGEKQRGKLYPHYSGYPGGLRFEALGRLVARRGPAEVFRLAVKRMLPANKLRAGMLKNLTVEK